MADNRMYMVHKNTGLAFCMGKRYGGNEAADFEYTKPDLETMEKFYRAVLTAPTDLMRECTIDPDGFVLVYESDGDAWEFTDRDYEGFPVIKFFQDAEYYEDFQE